MMIFLLVFIVLAPGFIFYVEPAAGADPAALGERGTWGAGGADPSTDDDFYEEIEAGDEEFEESEAETGEDNEAGEGDDELVLAAQECVQRIENAIRIYKDRLLPVSNDPPSYWSGSCADGIAQAQREQADREYCRPAPSGASVRLPGESTKVLPDPNKEGGLGWFVCREKDLEKPREFIETACKRRQQEQKTAKLKLAVAKSQLEAARQNLGKLKTTQDGRMQEDLLQQIIKNARLAGAVKPQAQSCARAGVAAGESAVEAPD